MPSQQSSRFNASSSQDLRAGAEVLAAGGVEAAALLARHRRRVGRRAPPGRGAGRAVPAGAAAEDAASRLPDYYLHYLTPCN